MNNNKVFYKLPSVFQNVTQRKFFDATADQLFSKKNSEKIDGYIGRRTSGIYDPQNDYYIPQKNKERTWYQLEPSAVVNNSETTEKSNYYFYYDLINRINSLGGVTDNHDRLFQSEQYSYSPPIDMDKFVNFQKYFWMPNRFDPIELVGLSDNFVENEILGKTKFVASEYSHFDNMPLQDMVFTSGMRVTFPDSTSYKDAYDIDGVGSSIKLVPDELKRLAAVTYNSLPWDGDVSVDTISIDNSLWDDIPWDVSERKITLVDYITIEKGAINSNLWSCANKWYHVSAIEQTVRFSGKLTPRAAERARRPIIEFFSNIELEKSGIYFYSNLDFYSTLNYTDVNLKTVAEVIEQLDSTYVSNGTRILFADDNSLFQSVGSKVNTIVWEVFILAEVVHLIPSNYNIVRLVTDGTIDEQVESRLLETGGNYVYDNATVTLPAISAIADGTEIRVRVAPGITTTVEAFTPDELLYNLSGTQSLEITFSNNETDIGFILTSRGWESFTIDTFVDTAEKDDIVFVKFGDFPVDGGNQGQSYYYNGTNWDLALNQKIQQNQTPKFALYDNNKITLADINEYPSSNFTGSDIFSFKISDEENIPNDPILRLPLVYKSSAQSSDIVFENNLITDRYTYVSANNDDVSEIPGYYYYRVVNQTDNRIDSTNWTFNNSWYLKSQRTNQRVVDKFAVFDEDVSEYQISVFPKDGRDDIEVQINGTRFEDFDYFVKNNIPGIRVNQVLSVDDDIETRTYTLDSLPDQSSGFYEIPRELESNPQNAEVGEYSYGEFVPHFSSIIYNQENNQINPSSRANMYRDTVRDPSLGNLIIQTSASVLKSMLFSDPKDVDVISAIRYAKSEYVNFKNSFISEASRYKYNFNQVDNFTIYNWVSEIIEAAGAARRTAGAFENSFMVAIGNPTSEEQFTIDRMSSNSSDNGVVLTNIVPGQFRTILNAELPGVIYDYNLITLYDTQADRNLDIGTDYSIERSYRSIIIRFSEGSQVTPGGRVLVDIQFTTSQLTSSIADVTLQNNILYVYEVSSDFETNTGTSQRLLLESQDYFVRYKNGLINIDFAQQDGYPRLDKLYYARVFDNSDPAYLPATPAKLGMSKVNVPRLEIDSSYILQQAVIVGHDGSRTIAFGEFARDSNNNLIPDENGAPYPVGLDVSGDVSNIPLTTLTKFYDVRDLLLIELERQIYTNIPSKFKLEYNLLLQESDIRPNALAATDYSRQEYYQLVTESLFSKWTASNRLDFRKNEFYNDLDWRTWNYNSLNIKIWDSPSNSIVEVPGKKLPGSWKGIYLYYYGTTEAHTKPWECIGFSEEPDWWRIANEEGFNDGFNGYGNNFTVTNTALWADIEQGIIRRGNRTGVLRPVQQRLGLLGNCNFNRDIYYQVLPNRQRTFRAPYNGVAGNDNLVPVQDNADKKTILDIFNYQDGDIDNITGNWIYGDTGPVENAWYNSSEFYFSLLEFFYMLKPAAFGEKFWDPESIDFVGDQFIDTRTGFRPVNSNQLVHAEVVNDNTIIRSGYQQYISDYLIFNNIDVKTNIGDKIRGLGVQLAHKIGGFTNRSRLKLYLESVSSTNQGSMLVPSNNFDVALYTGAPIRSYTYSGVLINVNQDSSFTVYGYDLISQEFKVLPAKINSKQVRINEGGTPESFSVFEFGKKYTEGQLVRYEGIFYRAASSLIANSFVSGDWIRLSGLPTSGGLSVVYRPDRTQDFQRVAYGTRLTSVQDVYDFMIGYGAYLESDGWKYDTIDIYGKVDNWKTAAGKFMFWATNNWETNNALALSPSATNITLEVEDGYPDNVERLTNGVYSILDKDGFAIPPENTIIQRDGKKITITPANDAEGVFYLRVNASETEHIVLVDNVTDFNDIVYDPVLNTRQSRLRFSGTRTLDWTGKLEAPGYLVQGKDLLPNLETLTENLRNLYNENSVDDNEDFENAARHLIGFENRAYLDALNVTDQAQFNFYQGFVAEKGTANAIDKLLRSSSINDKDKISYQEDWAFKSSDFGATANDISIEILSQRDNIKSDPQIYRLNYSLRDTGSISSIDIYSAEEIYKSVPTVLIDPPTGNADTPVTATAIAILNSARRIERIKITNKGAGYTSRPTIRIGKGQETQNLIIRNDSTFDPVTSLPINTDVAYATVQRTVIKDNPRDQIIDIDSDDTTGWISKPTGVDFENSVPTIVEAVNGLPTAGNVHRDDVDHAVYSNISALWDTRLDARPSINDTIWVAQSPSSKWAVYKVASQEAVEIALLTLMGAQSPGYDPSTVEAVFNIVSNDLHDRFSNNSFISNRNRYPDCIVGIDDAGVNYVAQETTLITELLGANGTTDKLLLTAKRISATQYQLFDANDEPVTLDMFFSNNEVPVEYDVKFSTFVNLRFSTPEQAVTLAGDEIDATDFVWIDNNGNNQWVVAEYSNIIPDVNNTPDINIVPYRKQQPLIDTSLYENIYLRERKSGKTIAQLPVYDPVKGILFGSVEKNVSYKTPSDPAKYQAGGNRGRTFGAQEVGSVWLDTSTLRFVDYEQPPVLTGDRAQAVSDIIEYRRDNWGRVFNGSPIDVYEWVKSETPPLNYRGNGSPRNTTDFIEDRTYDSFNDEFEVTYFFWVRSKTEFPATSPNRSMSTTEIANTIRNPGKQGIQYFAPIQFSATNQSFIIANADSLLSNRNCVIQLNYRQAESDNVKHDEWLLLRKGDRFSKVPDRLWDKMVDSLIGFTQPLPAGDYENGIPLDENGEFIVLPVPSTSLSEDQKYGLGIRPQQSMFMDDTEARRIIVNKLNSLIERLHFWESPLLGWDADISTSKFWSKVNWFANGFDSLNTRTNKQVESLQQLLNIADTLSDGDLVRVYPFSPNLLVDKSQVYVYDASADNVKLVARQDGAVKINDTIVDNRQSRTAKSELRQLLYALKSNVFVASNEVMQNQLFFTAVNFVVSEQKTLDWLFKTSYISFVQDGILLDQGKFFQPDLFNDFLDYVREAKPYHTKIRDSTYIAYRAPDEIANVTALDNFIGDYTCVDGVCSGGVDTYLREMLIKIEFARTGENSLKIDPNRGATSDIIDAPEFGEPDSHVIYSSEPATDELVYLDPAETLIIDTFTLVSPAGNDHWDIDRWDSANGFDELPDLQIRNEVSYKLHIRKYGIEYGEFSANADVTSAELVSYLPPSGFVPRAVITGNGQNAEIFVNSVDENGGIVELEIAFPGTGYTTAEIAIDHPSGSGFAATLEIANGLVVATTIINPGSGYLLSFDNGQVNSIEITKTTAFLSVSRENKMWIGTELIKYTNVTDNGSTLTLTGIQRGQKGTGIQKHQPGNRVFTGSDFLPDPLLSNNGIPGGDALVTGRDQYYNITRRYDNRRVRIPNCNPWFRRTSQDNTVFVANSAAAEFLLANGIGLYPKTDYDMKYSNIELESGDDLLLDNSGFIILER